MFKYVKSLEYPINIKKKDLRMAKYLITQYGGANCNRDFRKDEVMNNYCIYLKRRKNKPFCKFKNEEITFSLCRECNNKEYKKISADLCKKKQCSAEIKRKKSTSDKKNLVTSGQQKSNNNQIRKHSQTLAKKQQKPAKMKNKSNKLASLERKRKSVFTNNLDICYLCGKPREHLHEIIYGKNRINSIKYNFVIPLCANHHTGKDGIHFNKDLDLYYKRLCQIYFENNIGNRTEFIKIFGRSYL